MASGYALPNGNSAPHGPSSYASHSYSRSFSGAPQLSPQNGSSSLLHSSGYLQHGVKKASSHSGLYAHAETSRENSPLPSPSPELYKTPLEYNTHAFQEIPQLQALSLERGSMKVKSRPRGESDLGRPADPRSPLYRPSLDSIPHGVSSWLSFPEALTAFLIPLPYIFASAAYSSIAHEELGGGTSEVPTNGMLPRHKFSSDSGFIEACTLTSGTLLLVGILAKIRAAERVLDRRKEIATYHGQLSSLLDIQSAQGIVLRALSLGLPFYAAMQIGGLRTGLILLTAHAAGLTGADIRGRRTLFQWKHVLSERIATCAVVSMSVIGDVLGWTFRAPLLDLLLGYTALLLSISVLPLPLPGQFVPRTATTTSSPVVAKSPWMRLSGVSLLTQSTADVNITLLAGLVVSVLTVGLSTIWSTSPSLHASAVVLSTLTVASMSASILFAHPSALRSGHQAGLGFGCLLTAACAFLYSPSLWPGTICNGGLSALAFLGVLYDTQIVQDTSTREQGHIRSTHDDHHHHDHHAQHAHEGSHSGFTKLIMACFEPGSLIYGILSEKDSRRIAYFTLLNFAFMIVQGVYGYLSGSLGLLSDTVHMFFDCLGLVVGLGAAVASKWPTSPENPYGWGKLNTLAGFGNGVFLMLVSVEFIWEAIEGIVEGRELRHVKELLVVSIAGFLVNLVGLIAFGHAHAGHDHGHGHAHGHSHSHSQSHSHSHSHDHAHPNGHAHSHNCKHSHELPVDDHHNENMHGIFLHVAADAGGSLAVILSTILTLWKPWFLWDPLATMIIAIMIFVSAIPLVVASARKLLLIIPDELEYSIKSMLQELGEMRGVVGYAVPRLWIDDRGDSHDAAEQEHEQEHVKEHGHRHGHETHDHKHSSERVIKSRQKLSGIVHVFAAHAADLEDVRGRVEEFLHERNMDLVVHVEREADTHCWCGGASSQTMIPSHTG